MYMHAAPQVLALSPLVDLSRTRDFKEYQRIVLGLLQVGGGRWLLGCSDLGGCHWPQRVELPEVEAALTSHFPGCGCRSA